jgi:hypothetical protein
MKTPPNSADVRMDAPVDDFHPRMFCNTGLLGRRWPFCGHLRHARLANRHGLLAATVEPQLARKPASLCRPALGEWVYFGAGTGGGGLLPQTAASGNVSQPDPESLMKYPG